MFKNRELLSFCQQDVLIIGYFATYKKVIITFNNCTKNPWNSCFSIKGKAPILPIIIIQRLCFGEILFVIGTTAPTIEYLLYVR